MKKSRKNTAIKRNNQANNSMVTGENMVVPRVLSPDDSRIDIKIPKSSPLYTFLNGDKTSPDNTYRLKLERLLAIKETATSQLAEKHFDAFLAVMCVYYPEKAEAFKRLRALIFWHIIQDDPLTEVYWNKLRKCES